MPSQRLTLAFEQITAGDWAIFEKFAAEFLAVEYPSLRTMASPAGDRGRDGELHCPTEVCDTAVQYSVTKDWKSKVRSTVKTLAGTMPRVTQLIYATSQVVGPAADDLRAEMREGFGVSLDVRDQSWFVERELTHAQRQAASEELAQRFVDPLLSARGLKNRVALSLTREEAKIALLHLSLDAADQATSKGLTKSAFESLTLAALHDTTADTRLSVASVVAGVQAMLPSGHETQVADLTRSALARLARKGGPVHHHRSTDDYCLSFAKRSDMHERAAQFLLDEEQLENEIRLAMAEALPDLGSADPGCIEAAHGLRQAIELLFVQRGEAFASALQTGEVQQIDTDELIATLTRGDNALLKAVKPPQATAIVRQVLARPSIPTQRHLRRLADAYTLFAFLREAPDVQRVVVRLFSDGDLWLDTTVVLPLLAETLLVERTERHYTVLLRATLDAGIRLHVTDGVVEEVERHINRSLTFARTATDQWRSRVPFLYAVYASTGRGRAEFPGWAARFAGAMRPKEDVRDYLADVFGVTHRDLKDESDGAPIELRSAVQEIWHASHERRRSRSSDEDLDQITRLRLVSHDVENCVGVIRLRKGGGSSPMGYRAWFLTLDRTALTLGKELRSRLGHDAPASPALSPDFLTEFLRLGPIRTAVERDARVSLPLLTDISIYENMPIEFIELAEHVRRQSADEDERIVQRRVRDALDSARLRSGDEARGGLPRAQQRLRDAITRQTCEDTRSSQ